jgi:hypothetical protein
MRPRMQLEEEPRKALRIRVAKRILSTRPPISLMTTLASSRASTSVMLSKRIVVSRSTSPSGIPGTPYIATRERK